MDAVPRLEADVARLSSYGIVSSGDNWGGTEPFCSGGLSSLDRTPVLSSIEYFAVEVSNSLSLPE